MGHTSSIPERAQDPAEQVRLLLELQALDRNAKEMDEARRAIPELLARTELEFQSVTGSESGLRERLSETEHRRRDAERKLEETTEKLTKSKGKLLGIKDNREYQAALAEIATLEELIGQQEETVLLLMEELEELQGELAEAEKQVEEVRNRLEEERKVRADEAARLEADLRACSSQRASLAGNLDSDLIDRYEHVASRGNGLALVALRDGICQGCSMRVPPQLGLEVKRGEAVISCPHCHRMLFIESA